MTKKDLEKRVEELERKIRDLESRLIYYVPQPIYVPVPAPALPLSPFPPIWDGRPTIT